MSNNNKKNKKSYKSLEFLNSPEARPVRILSEYLDPKRRLKNRKIKDIVVFFGSSRILSPEDSKKRFEEIKKRVKNNNRNNINLLYEKAKKDFEMSKYYNEARKLAKRITQWASRIKEEHKRFVVCTGAGPGIMEAANRGASDAGGISIGFNISLPFEQKANKYIPKDLIFEFHYFFMRKFWFFYPAKALIIFPGGYGTLDELFEILTLVQSGKSIEPMPVVLYGSDYWSEIINFDTLAECGTISCEDKSIFKIYDDVDECFKYLKNVLTRHFL